MKNKWVLFSAALVLIAINLVNADFSTYRQLSISDLAPVVVIALVSFLLKTGVLSAVLIGLKNCGNGSSVNKQPGIAAAIPGNLYYRHQ